MNHTQYAWGRSAVILLYAAAVVSLSSCGGGSGGGDTGGTSVPDAGRQYFPIAVGDRWVYRQWSGESDATSQLKLVKATGTETVDGREAMILRSIRALDDIEDGVQRLAVTDADVTLLPNPSPQPGALPIPALEQLRFPLVAGSSYDQLDKTFDMGADYDGDGRNETLRIVSKVSMVGFGTVQADFGTFTEAAHVRTVVTQTGIYSSGRTPVTVISTVDDWYAPRVGLVRQDTVVRGIGSASSTHMTLVGYSVNGVRSDTSSPTATLVSPAVGSVQDRFTQIQLSYTEPMDISTVDAAAIELRDAADTVVPVVAYRDSSAFKFHAANGPLPTGSYTVSVNGRATDLVGNPTTPATWSFDVDATAPALVAISPTNNSKYVPVDVVMTIDLSEEIDPATVSGRVLLIGVQHVPIDVSVQGRRIIVRPLAPLAQRTSYTLQILAITDKIGNEFAGAATRFDTDPGQFDYTQSVSSANSPEAVAVGDINGDGRDDVVMTNWFYFSPSTDYKLFVFRQQPDGKLGSAIALATQATYVCSPNSVAIADVNGDGRKDVIVGESSCGIEIFLQDANGELVSTGVAASQESYMIRVADLDGDSRMDIVGVGWGTNRVAVWKQTAGGTLDGPRVYALEHFGYEGLAIGDVNGDGRPDVVVSSGQLDASKALAILPQQADGSFDTPQYRPVGASGYGRSVAVGDVNGDGRADIVVGRSFDYTIAMFHQDASGALGPAQELNTDRQVEAVEVVDLDGDGFKDIVFSNSSGFGVYMQQSGALSAIKWYPASISGGFSPQSITTGDINGDGYPDLVGIGIVYMLNRGPQALPSSKPRSAKPKAPAARAWMPLQQLPTLQ